MEVLNVVLNVAAVVAIAVAAWVGLKARSVVEAQRAAIEALQASNRAWQSEHAAMKETAARLGAENDRLAAENAQLRAKTDLDALMQMSKESHDATLATLQMLESGMTGAFAGMTQELRGIAKLLDRCFPDNGGARG